jgi:flagellar basal body P-ring formation protein FlgA
MPKIRNIGAAGGLVLLLAGQLADAQEVWRATRTLAPGDVVRGDDVTQQLPSGRVIDAMPSTSDIVGMEVKRRVYAGHDVAVRDVGTRSAVKAGTNVTVLWRSGDMSLELEARAVEAGAIGEEIRVLNPASLRTIRGTVVGDGMVEVKSQQ